MDTNLKQMNTKGEPEKILHKELCYRIQKCIFNVSNKYGKGFKEVIYQKALEEEFEIEGLSYEPQKRISVHSLETGRVLGVYVPDEVVGNLIIIELKASAYTTKQDEEQQLSYLKASTYEVGYLVNFSTPKLYIKRSIYTNDRKPFIKKISVHS